MELKKTFANIIQKYESKKQPLKIGIFLFDSPEDLYEHIKKCTKTSRNEYVIIESGYTSSNINLFRERKFNSFDILIADKCPGPSDAPWCTQALCFALHNRMVLHNLSYIKSIFLKK